MTRGRTGSTAVIDALNQTAAVSAAQELFLVMDFTMDREVIAEVYPTMFPFILWEAEGGWGRRIYGRLFGKKALINAYLREAESKASANGKAAFGFKVLSHHFEETPLLKEVLLERGYQAIYLTRNIPRQVLSGMVAKLRGKYHAHAAEGYEDNSRYTINLDEFESHVRWEAQAAKNDLALLKAAGFKFIEVSYEEFMNARRGFFERLLGFLGVASEEPQASSYSVMIKALEHTIENYEAVADRVAAMGMRIE